MLQPSFTPGPPEGPATALASGNRIAPVYLVPLLAATQAAGIAGTALFQGTGLVPGDFDVPGFMVSPKEAHTVVRRALRLLDLPDLGLTLGMHTRFTERGALALGLLAAASVGDAIELTLQYPCSAGHLMAVTAERGRYVHRMIAEPMIGNDDIAPFLVDIMFAGWVQMLRQVTDRHYGPATVELARPRPPNAAAYEAPFACPVRFGRSRNVLATDLALLDQPLPMANAMAYRLSQQLLEREGECGRPGAPSDLGLAVERAIRRALPLAASPADLATALNLGERSLRRKLAQEGLSFRGLLDDVRKARALELMAGATRATALTAMQCGFSDLRAFSRAFKRWTGKPPAMYLSAWHVPQVDAGEDDGR